MIFASKYQLKLMALILSISAFSFSSMAFDMEVKRDWLACKEELSRIDNLKTLADIDRKITLQNAEYKLRKAHMHNLALDYLDDVIRSYDLDNELKNYGNNAINLFSVELLMESLERFRASKIPEIKALMKRYDQLYAANAIPLFRLSGKEIERESPTEEKGGFHRGNQSIFMDITRTTNAEWLFILIHELYHALDESLHVAVGVFSDEELFSAVKVMSSKKSNLLELNSNEEKLLSKWVLAGLDRGLFAEFRAWSFGLSIYGKGLDSGLWRRIPFIENVLSFKDKNEEMKPFVYRYLNERSGMTNEGILGRAIIQEKIKLMRSSFKPI